MSWFENTARMFTSISGGGPFRDGSGKVACHITGSVAGWYNQVEWVVVPDVLVGTEQSGEDKPISPFTTFDRIS